MKQKSVVSLMKQSQKLMGAALQQPAPSVQLPMEPRPRCAELEEHRREGAPWGHLHLPGCHESLLLACCLQPPFKHCFPDQH